MSHQYSSLSSFFVLFTYSRSSPNPFVWFSMFADRPFNILEMKTLNELVPRDLLSIVVSKLKTRQDEPDS